MKTPLIAAIITVLASACGVSGQPPSAAESLPTLNEISSLPPTNTPLNTVPPASDRSMAPLDNKFGLTYQSLDGNRYIQGAGSISTSAPLDITLSGIPLWVVGVPLGEDSYWVIALEDGRLQAFLVSESAATEIQITPTFLQPGEPPVLAILAGEPRLLNGNQGLGSPSSHPVPLQKEGAFAFIQTDGFLTIQEYGSRITLDVNAMRDSRLLVDEHGNLLLLNRPTTYYDHGVLGDAIESGGLALVDISPEPRISKEIHLPEESVIEGIMPIWTDLTGDGVRQIIVTQSSYSGGGQLVIYNQNGIQAAASASIGQSYRWRHQIAAAPFGPNGEIELAAVLTPHIGGVVEFFQMQGNQLIRVAQVSGFTSHTIGSRNLDMAVAGDFDGDGLVEILLPSQDLSTLGAIQRQQDSAIVDWTVPLDGHLNTNLAALKFDNGSLALAAGMGEGFLRIWLPD